jgi:hypothetical protein
LFPDGQPWLLTETEPVDALRVRLHFLLADGRRRPVIVNREDATVDQVARIGAALAADNVVSKEEARRRGWR